MFHLNKNNGRQKMIRCHDINLRKNILKISQSASQKFLNIVDDDVDGIFCKIHRIEQSTHRKLTN